MMMREAHLSSASSSLRLNACATMIWICYVSTAAITASGWPTNQKLAAMRREASRARFHGVWHACRREQN